MSTLRHGHNRRGKTTKTYGVWLSMVARCKNPKGWSYKYYGGRGIKVCKEWEIFDNFLRDMGKSPDKMQLDRIDNSLGYNKENCRWASRITNANNRRDCRYLSFKGNRMTLTEWARYLNVPRGRISDRIDKLKWNLSEALTIKKYGNKTNRIVRTTTSRKVVDDF